MRPCPRPLLPTPRQLSLLPALTGPGQPDPDERRETVALLAALLIEAAGLARQEAADDRE